MCKKKSYVVCSAFAVAAVTMLFVPMTSSAASAPIMKRLDQIPPAWSQKLPGAERFELVLDGAAVLDKETGLVWEQTVSTNARIWTQAIIYCDTKEVAGRKGWHLPTIEQLSSLVDSSVVGAPKLPAGHPFTGVGQTNYWYYWSATSVTDDAAVAWVVNFASGELNLNDKPDPYQVWCVRGGQSYDAH